MLLLVGGVNSEFEVIVDHLIHIIDCLSLPIDIRHWIAAVVAFDLNSLIDKRDLMRVFHFQFRLSHFLINFRYLYGFNYYSSILSLFHTTVLT